MTYVTPLPLEAITDPEMLDICVRVGLRCMFATRNVAYGCGRTDHPRDTATRKKPGNNP